MSQMQTVPNPTDRYIYYKMWSFYRFLHFIATKGRLNPASERSEVAIVFFLIQPTMFGLLIHDFRKSTDRLPEKNS
jgi:hypothetical protein